MSISVFKNKTYIVGDGTPSNSEGVSNGSLYVDRLTGSLYTFHSAAWHQAGGGVGSSSDTQVLLNILGSVARDADNTWYPLSGDGTPNGGGTGLQLGDPNADVDGWGYAKFLNITSYPTGNTVVANSLATLTLIATPTGDITTVGPVSPLSVETQLNGSHNYHGATGIASNLDVHGTATADTYAVAAINGTAQWFSAGAITGVPLAGVSGYANVGAGTVPIAADVPGWNTISGGTVGTSAAFYAKATTQGGAISGADAAFYAEAWEGATNPYVFWSDEQGVFRIKADNTFNSVYQAIPALYNPQFTKYTPGAVNYERIILGQWSSNVAQIGTEKGGTGTLRKLQLIGAGLLTNSTLIPTADPHVVGQVWANSGILTVSAG